MPSTLLLWRLHTLLMGGCLLHQSCTSINSHLLFFNLNPATLKRHSTSFSNARCSACFPGDENIVDIDNYIWDALQAIPGADDTQNGRRLWGGVHINVLLAFFNNCWYACLMSSLVGPPDYLASRIR